MKLLWETPRQCLEFTKRWIDFVVYWSDGTYWKDDLGEFPNDPKFFIRSNSGGSYLWKERWWKDVWSTIGEICMDKPIDIISTGEIKQPVTLLGDVIEHGVQSTLSIEGNKNHILLHLFETDIHRELIKTAIFRIIPQNSADKFSRDSTTGVVLTATPEQIRSILSLWEAIQKTFKPIT